jgi:hypothetical protein
MSEAWGFGKPTQHQDEQVCQWHGVTVKAALLLPAKEAVQQAA